MRCPPYAAQLWVQGLPIKQLHGEDMCKPSDIRLCLEWKRSGEIRDRQYTSLVSKHQWMKTIPGHVDKGNPRAALKVEITWSNANTCDKSHCRLTSPQTLLSIGSASPLLAPHCGAFVKASHYIRPCPWPYRPYGNHLPKDLRIIRYKTFGARILCMTHARISWIDQSTDSGNVEEPHIIIHRKGSYADR